MTSALDRLIAEALKSSDPQLRALAAEVQEKCNRGRGRPKVKLPSADDPDVVFTVLDLLHSRRYTGKVIYWQGVDQFGKPVVDPEWPDGEPIAITRPRKESKTAIAKALAAELGVSLNTARPLVREVIAKQAPDAPVDKAFSLIGQLILAQKSVKK